MEIQEDDDFADDRYAGVHDVDEEEDMMEDENEEVAGQQSKKVKNYGTTTTTTSMEEVEMLDMTGKAEKKLPFIEKYRPASLEEVVAQDDIVQTIMRLMEKNALPHLLLYGPPGTGKT